MSDAGKVKRPERGQFTDRSNESQGMSSRPAVVRHLSVALSSPSSSKFFPTCHTLQHCAIDVAPPGGSSSDTVVAGQVIDNGTGYTKMGYAGNAEPSYIVPTCIAASDDKGSNTLSKKGKIGQKSSPSHEHTHTHTRIHSCRRVTMSTSTGPSSDGRAI